MKILKNKNVYKLPFFAVISVFVLFFTIHSLGYEINWKDFSLTQTGSVLIGTYPKEARVYIDDTFAGETSSFFLTHGKLISGLTPKKHSIRIEKDGYASWSKILKIEARSVTEIRNIILSPQNYHIETIKNPMYDFIFSDSHALIAYVTKQGVKVWDATKQKEVRLSKNPKEQIGKIIFGANENYVIVESLIKNNVIKYLLNLSSMETLPIEEDDLENYITIQQYPADNLDFFALSNQNILYKINSLTQHEPTIIAKNISKFYIFEDSMVYATKKPTLLYEKNLTSGKINQLIHKPLDYVNASTKILNSGDENIAIINSKNELFLYKNNKKAFQKIGDNVLHAIFSSDKKKLMWQNKNKIYVYYLKNISTQPQKNKGDIDLIVKSQQTITNIEWFSYDDAHIFFVTNNKLKIIELDGREQRNEYDIMEIKNLRKMRYNSFSDVLYILDGDILKKISFINE